MPINKSNPIEVPEIIVVPSPWQLAYSALPKDVKQRIYDIVRDRIEGTATNPHKEEYDAAKKEFEKIGGNYWPDNALEITTRFDKALTNYHRWDPLNSEEGYQALKDFHDNPGVYLRLATYPYFHSRMPISHSELSGPRGYINLSMSDPGYNIVTNNCSDATRRCLEHVKGTKMPERWYSITTPNKVRRWAAETFPTIPAIKGDSVLVGPMFEPRYEYLPNVAESIRQNDTTQDIIPLNITELSRYIDYTER